MKCFVEEDKYLFLYETTFITGLQTLAIINQYQKDLKCTDLLVGKHQHWSFTELVWLKHSVEFLLGDGEPLPVCGVNHQEDELCVGVVSVPGSPQWLLPPQVPHDEV